MQIKGANGESLEVFADFAVISRRGVSRLRKRQATIFFPGVKDLQFRGAGLVMPGYLRFSAGDFDRAPGISAAGGDEKAILFTREQEPEFRKVTFVILFRLRNGRLPDEAEVRTSSSIRPARRNKLSVAATVIVLLASLAALSIWSSDRAKVTVAPNGVPAAVVMRDQTSAETRDQTAVVTRDQYGSRWPWLKFDQGIISCSNDEVTIKLGNVVYGLNGHARSRSRHPDPREMMGRVPNTESISADGRGLYDLGASGDLIQVGLGLCQKQRR